MSCFSETQRFRQWWIWLILGFTVVVGIGSLWASNGWKEPFMWMLLVPSLLIVPLLYYWRLDTRLDAAGVHYRVFPLFSWRTTSWADIKSLSVDTYGFVGYGIRIGFDGWVYNVAGQKGLRVVRKDKPKFTLGTQKPDELQAFLAANTALLTA